MGEVLGRLDSSEKSVADIQTNVTNMNLTLDEYSRAVSDLRADIDKRDNDLPGMIKAIVDETIARRSTPALQPRHDAGITPRPSRQERPAVHGRRVRPLRPGAGSASNDDQDEDYEPDRPRGHLTREEDKYWRARKCLRLWPISRLGEIEDKIRMFFVTELGMDQ